jgi:cyclophilin family peptidyl-prolyl cis-trans isomerase/HEAT repeat protein
MMPDRLPVCTVLAVTLLLAAGCVPPGFVPGRPTPPVVEADAAARILEMEDRRIFDEAELRRFAASPEPDTRRRTALALGRLMEPAGGALLEELSTDADVSVATAAAFALGQLGDTVAVPKLTALLGDGTGAPIPTASEAAYALGKIRGEAARSALRAVLSAPAPPAEVVGSTLLAIWRLPRGEEHGDIVRWTTARDPDLRWRAAYALVRRPDPRSVSVLLALASDTDARVRAQAVRGLTAPLADSAGIGAAEVLPAVLRLVHDEDYATRVNAVRTLGTYAAPGSVEALRSALLGEEWHLALAAAESLGRLESSAVAASGSLTDRAADVHVPEAVRIAALLALSRLAPDRALELAGRFAVDERWRKRSVAARVAATGGEQGRALWAELVRDGDPRVANAALDAAVAAAAPDVVPLRSHLLGSLASPDVQVRATGIRGLGLLRDPSALPLLLDAFGRALNDDRPDAALAALDAIAGLRAVGTSGARALFRRYPRPDDYLVRLRARALFADTAVQAWGSPAPIETGLAPAEYREIVERWVLPAVAGRRPRARIVTKRGVIDLELFSDDAPMTVRNLARLAERGDYFAGQEWPRVVPNFVVQGGDPRGDMSGGPGYSIRDEHNLHRYDRGTLGMALSGPDTGGSQFFIVHSPQPHLDGGYTLFGRVVGGGEIAERILPGEPILRIEVDY